HPVSLRVSDGSEAEDEAGGDTDEGERLSEGDTDPHHDLQTAGELGLTGNALDRLADDDADADGGADGGEAVADSGERAGDFSENRSCVHGVFLSVLGGGCRPDQCSSATASWM